MYHYVYKIEFETGHVYYGSRSCKCPPNEDKYLGSPVRYKDFWSKYKPTKTILEVFNDRESAYSFEQFMIEVQWAKSNTSKTLSLNASVNGKCNNFGFKFPTEFGIEVGKRKAKEYKFWRSDGVIFEGKNISEFARQMNLSSPHLVSVLRGDRFYTEGWTNSKETHDLYLTCYESRGVSFNKSKNVWVVFATTDGKAKHVYFKDRHVALAYRDALEKTGYIFKVLCKNWKQKLSQQESNAFSN